MRAKIERDLTGRGVRVWLWEHAADEVHIFRQVDRETWRIDVEVPYAEPGEPSLYLSEEALDAILETVLPEKPDTTSIERHLSDALGVRDRLLDLVEKLA